MCNPETWYTYLVSDRLKALIVPDRQGSCMFLVGQSQSKIFLEVVFGKTWNLPFTILDPSSACYNVLAFIFAHYCEYNIANDTAT